MDVASQALRPSHARCLSDFALIITGLTLAGPAQLAPQRHLQRMSLHVQQSLFPVVGRVPNVSATSLEGSSVPGPRPGLDPSISPCPPPAQPALPSLPRGCSDASERLWLASRRELPAQPGCERLSLQKWPSEPWRRWRWR